MEIKFSVINSILYLFFYGELDEHSVKNSRGIIDKLIEDNVKVHSVVFNLSELSFMDSTGVGLLIGRYKKLKSLGIKAYIKSPPISVRKVIEVCGLNELMPEV